MWLDVNLDWHYHIDVMRSKISRRIGVLKRVRTYLTEDYTTITCMSCLIYYPRVYVRTSLKTSVC